MTQTYVYMYYLTNTITHLFLLMHEVISEPNVHRIQQYPQIRGFRCEVLTSMQRKILWSLF